MAQTKVQLLQPDLGDVIDFDASTLFVDGADNRIGIRNTNPQYELDVTGTINATNFRGNISVGTIDDWITHTGDTDTKIGFPAVDKFQVFAGGGPRTTVTSTGLGIGTDSPAELLNLASSNPMIRLTDTDNSAYSSIGGEGGNLYLYTNSSSRDFIFRGTAEVARITGDGKLAIGNTSPQQLLHVWPDAANTTSAYVRVTAGDRNSNTGLDLGHDASGNGQVNMVSNGTLTFSTNNTPRIKIANNSAATAIGTNAAYNAMLTVRGDISGALLALKATEDTNRLMVSGTDSNGVEVNLYDGAGGQKGILGVSGSEFFIKAPNNSAPLTFYTHNGSSIGERLRIDSAGRLLLGRTSGSFAIDLQTGSDSTFRMRNSGETGHGSHDAKIVAGGSYYQNPNIVGSTIKFSTYNGSSEGERARITSGGSLIVGNQTSTSYKLCVSEATHTRVEVISTSNDSAGAWFKVYNSGTLTSQSTIRTSGGSLQVYTGTTSEAERLRIASAGGTNIWNDSTYFAANIAECNTDHLALNVRKSRQGQTKAIALGAIGHSSYTSIQGYDTSNNSANNLLLNPLAGDVVVGGPTVGSAGTFGMQASGHVRTVLASGTAGDTLFGAISGVSNGFQINTDASNNQIYTFHNGSNYGLRIGSSGKVGLGIDPVYSFQQLRSGAVEWVIGSSNAGSASLIFDGDANGDAVGGDYSWIRHTTDGNMEYAARNGSGGAAHHMFKTNTTEQFRIHDDGIMAQPFGCTQHNGGSASAIINTSGRFKVNGNQFATNYKQGLSVGWYTIAINSGGRSSGRIGIRETYSSRHQACVFYAGHHYGGGTAQNCINTIFSSGRHGGNPIGAIRIKAYGTYDGALLQVYVRDSGNGLQAYLLGDNMQDQGWVMKDWIADGTDPGGMSNWSSINSNGGVAAYSDMHEIEAGGASFDGHVIPGRDDVTDLGCSNYKFDDIYATNTTIIATSDERLKQDIASLTTAEMNAAKRMSALFKTFRWKSRVSEKGDKARTHTGIIAQQVKAALEAEGLDPTKYGFYGFNEWYEHADGTKLPLETATRQGDTVEEGTNATLGGNIVVPAGFEKKSRYSIRIGELLAFIAAYNEQRFASIESRLTALES